MESKYGNFEWAYRDTVISIEYGGTNLEVGIRLEGAKVDSIKLCIKLSSTEIKIIDLTGNGDNTERTSKGYGRLVLNIAWQILRRNYSPEILVTGELSPVGDHSQSSHLRRVQFWQSAGLHVTDPDNPISNIQSSVKELVIKSGTTKNQTSPSGVPLFVDLDAFWERGSLAGRFQPDKQDIIETFPFDEIDLARTKISLMDVKMEATTKKIRLIESLISSSGALVAAAISTWSLGLNIEGVITASLTAPITFIGIMPVLHNFDVSPLRTRNSQENTNRRTHVISVMKLATEWLRYRDHAITKLQENSGHPVNTFISSIIDVWELYDFASDVRGDL